MPAVVSVRQLAVTYHTGLRRTPVPALLPLDFELRAGNVLGVLGPNGSGKTTLLRVLAGLQRPTAGSASILGAAPTATALRRRVAYQPEGPPPLPVLTGRELLQWHGCQLGLPNRQADARADALLRQFDLARAAHRQVRTYSTGMQRRVLLAAALLGEPAVLLLDEPTAGLDPVGSELVVAALRERAAAGAVLVMASHHLQEVEQVCDSVLVLHDGRCVARGDLGELLATGDQALVVRGIAAERWPAIEAAVRTAGGEPVRREPVRNHLYALYRRFYGPPDGGAAP